MTEIYFRKEFLRHQHVVRRGERRKELRRLVDYLGSSHTCFCVGWFGVGMITGWALTVLGVMS